MQSHTHNNTCVMVFINILDAKLHIRYSTDTHRLSTSFIFEISEKFTILRDSWSRIRCHLPCRSLASSLWNMYWTWQIVGSDSEIDSSFTQHKDTTSIFLNTRYNIIQFYINSVQAAHEVQSNVYNIFIMCIKN